GGLHRIGREGIELGVAELAQAHDRGGHRLGRLELGDEAGLDLHFHCCTACSLRLGAPAALGLRDALPPAAAAPAPRSRVAFFLASARRLMDAPPRARDGSSRASSPSSPSKE